MAPRQNYAPIRVFLHEELVRLGGMLRAHLPGSFEKLPLTKADQLKVQAEKEKEHSANGNTNANSANANANGGKARSERERANPKNP